MKNRHFFYFIMLQNSFKNEGKTIHIFCTAILFFFRDEIINFTKKKIEIKINEVKEIDEIKK